MLHGSSTPGGNPHGGGIVFNSVRFAGVACIKRGPIDDSTVRISSAASMTVFITVLAVTYLEHKACLSLSPGRACERGTVQSKRSVNLDSVLNRC